VLSLSFQEEPLFESSERIEKVNYKPVLQIDLFKQSAEDELEMMYLTKGITWIPGYYIELLDNKKARVILRSTLINDAEDIEDSDVNFVVGVPNFKYATELSPLYGSKEVSKFIGKLDVNYQPLNTMNLNQFSNSIRSYNHAGNDQDLLRIEPKSTTETIKSINATQSQDLFFYTAKNVNLKKGGRGFYDIFEINCPVKHEYFTELNSSGFANAPSWHHLKLGLIETIPVHHSLKIANKSEFPFTTGTALLVSSENGFIEPISQDQVKYTPKGGTLLMNMNEAIDVFVSEDHIMKKKSERKMRYPKHQDAPWYDQITIKDKITIENHKAESIELNMNKVIYGEIVDIHESGKSEMKPDGHRQLNSENSIKFKLRIGANEKKTIDVTYTTYVMH
jgi:hypothetical protein